MAIKVGMSIKVLAPAKINLTLHVTGKRPDGYHDLHSLVSFCDMGDVVELAEAESLQLQITGPFARAFIASDLDTGRQSTNLVIRAIYALSDQLRLPPNISVTLHKNLPLAAGLGGGSSDAAATIWGLQRLWQRQLPATHLEPLLAALGSDVPVCYQASPSIMLGRGEVVTAAPELPEVPIVLINPLQPCPTASVFMAFAPPGSQAANMPADGFHSVEDLLGFLRQRGRNDLEGPAQTISPHITPLLSAMQTQQGCGLARLAGSGATVFGLFYEEDSAEEAALQLQAQFPKYWVRQSFLNRFQRY